MQQFTCYKFCKYVNQVSHIMKTFIGPRLRRLRVEHGQTQAQMARALGISTSYVNLLEKNERPVSVPVMLKLFELYGIEWRDIAEDDETAHLADLRAALADPIFEGDRPDLTQIRAALTHAPDLALCFLRLHRSYLAASDQLLSVAEAGEGGGALLRSAPEATVHNFFRKNRNHFAALEEGAEAFWGAPPPASDDIYAALKQRLLDRLGVRVQLMTVAEMPGTLREYDERRRLILLSEALDHPNRVFQLVHVAGLIEQSRVIDGLLSDSGVSDAHGRTRCRVELANYFAAAVLMPYGAFLTEALASRYDFDHLATRFGVSFEQACHRATTLQRRGAMGVPFFSCASTRRAMLPSASTPPISIWPNMAAPVRALRCIPVSACRAGSCRNWSKCPTKAGFSCSRAPSTGPVSPAILRMCGWPSPWAARSNMSGPSVTAKRWPWGRRR